MKRSGSPQASSDRKAARTASDASAASASASTSKAPEAEESESYSNALQALRQVDVSAVGTVDGFRSEYDAALKASALRQVRPTLQWN